jgi:hypothetical protein
VVAVTGALQYPENSGSSGVSAGGALPSGQLGIISAASLVNVLPYSVYGGWITATHPSAPLKAVPPAAPPNSGLDLKAFQNLGYTGQWFVFAGFVIFMWLRLVRREAEARADVALGLVPDGFADGDPVPVGPADDDRVGPADDDRVGPADDDRVGPADDDRVGLAEEDRVGPVDGDGGGPVDEDPAGSEEEDRAGRASDGSSAAHVA